MKVKNILMPLLFIGNYLLISQNNNLTEINFDKKGNVISLLPIKIDKNHLLFLFKQPREFGAKLWNGLYYRLARSGDAGLAGTPQAIDLNLISAPPAQADRPPYRPALRDDVAPGVRWIERLTIEP